jgi:threonine dehydrogenase-like Zn-dependent dehydrogenase
VAKKVYNCHVVAICSGRNADFVRQLGADEVVDYTKNDVPKALLNRRPEGRGFDLYIDCVGGTEMFGVWVCTPPPSYYMCLVNVAKQGYPSRNPSSTNTPHISPSSATKPAAQLPARPLPTSPTRRKYSVICGVWFPGRATQLSFCIARPSTWRR